MVAYIIGILSCGREPDPVWFAAVEALEHAADAPLSSPDPFCYVLARGAGPPEGANRALLFQGLEVVCSSGVGAGGEVHGNPGLYVGDAAALPAVIGAPPTQTIGTWAEKKVARHITRNN